MLREDHNSQGDPARVSRADGPDWLALAGVVLTIVLHLVLQANHPNIYFIAGASLFWIGFAVVNAWHDPGIVRTWGFHRDNLGRASVVPAVVFLIAAAGLAVYGIVQHGSLRLPSHLPLLLILYPFWGWVQQFLALGVVLRNLERIEFLRSKTWLIVVMGASLFSLVHPHDLRMTAGTFVLEVVVILTYLRWRNLWPLGVLHGWIGALYFLWALDRDMFVENFGSWM